MKASMKKIVIKSYTEGLPLVKESTDKRYYMRYSVKNFNEILGIIRF